MLPHLRFFFFFFNDTATTEIYTLSLHDALPIFYSGIMGTVDEALAALGIQFQTRSKATVTTTAALVGTRKRTRSEEHTSELQSHLNLVCRLLLEKKKKNT